MLFTYFVFFLFIFSLSQILKAIQYMQNMHQDARDVLMSEMVCDTVYSLFYGGFRFTYDRAMSKQKIHPQESKIEHIVCEIKHRLGYMPTLAQTEPSQRHLMYLIITNNLAFHNQKCDDVIYNMRDAISYPTIGEEVQLARHLRHFKNATRAHHANTRHLVNTQHMTYKRTVFRFFDDIIDNVRIQCGLWICKQSAEISCDKTQLIRCLHAKVDELDKLAQK